MDVRMAESLTAKNVSGDWSICGLRQKCSRLDGDVDAVANTDSCCLLQLTVKHQVELLLTRHDKTLCEGETIQSAAHHMTASSAPDGTGRQTPRSRRIKRHLDGVVLVSRLHCGFETFLPHISDPRISEASF